MSAEFYSAAAEPASSFYFRMDVSIVRLSASSKTTLSFGLIASRPVRELQQLKKKEGLCQRKH